MRISDWSSDVCSSDLEQRPHQRSFGFRASRSQSPNRLTASTRMASAAPGKMVIHHEPENRKSLPTLTRVPSDGEVAGTPMPRNDRVDSDDRDGEIDGGDHQPRAYDLGQQDRKSAG